MNYDIQWLTSGVDFPDIDARQISRWIEKVAARYGRTPRQLGYMFCDDAKILEVNRQFLQHDYFTDIITFDYSRGRMISGDIFISLDTVRSNAKLFDQPYERELRRVIIHGVLHLCGINDKGPGEREIMQQAEDEALELLKTID